MFVVLSLAIGYFDDEADGVLVSLDVSLSMMKNMFQYTCIVITEVDTGKKLQNLDVNY